MRRFVLGWKTLKHEKRLQAFIVNYADDMVICCRSQADEALAKMRDMMSKLKLTVNEKKTRVCRVPEEKFDFLGYTFGWCYSPKTGRAYLGTVPSKKRAQRICAGISELTRRSQTQRDAETLVADLNRRLIGWANYFCLGPVSKAYRTVDRHTRRRLRQWLCAKHQRPGQGIGRYSDATLHEGLGLVRLTKRTASFPWATPGTFLREPDASIAHVRFDEPGVETEWETLLGHRRPGRPGYVYAALPPLRHTSTLPKACLPTGPTRHLQHNVLYVRLSAPQGDAQHTPGTRPKA